MKILAFGHQKRTGKDTAAKFLTSYVRTNCKNSNIQHHGFADKLKAVCYDLYKWSGLEPGWYYDTNPIAREVILPKIGLTPRQIWISVGQALREKVYENTWLEYLFHNAKCSTLIIRDMRFPTEADFILQNGGKIYKILRPSIPHTSDAADDPLLDYDKWTGVIVNDGTLNDFNNKLIEELGAWLISS